MSGPPTAVVDQEVNYTVTITNTGNVEAQALTVRDPLVPGLQFVRGDPAPIHEGNLLTWTLGLCAGRQEPHRTRMTAVARALGKISNCVSVTSFEGLHATTSALTTPSAWKAARVTPQPGNLPPGTEIAPGTPPGGQSNQNSQGTRPVPPEYPEQFAKSSPARKPSPARLVLDMDSPASRGVGVPVQFNISLTNTGGVPARGVILIAEFDPGFEHETKAMPVELPLNKLDPGDRKNLPLMLTPRRAGPLNVTVKAGADGLPTIEVKRTVVVPQARISVSINGPQSTYAGQNVTWELRVTNPTDIPLANVEARSELPAAVKFVSATELGQPVNGQVVWNIGNMGPRDSRVLQVVGRCDAAAQNVANRVTVSADGGLSETAEARLDILGLPALTMDITKSGDPVARGGRSSTR